MAKSLLASTLLNTKVLGGLAFTGALVASGAMVMTGSTAAFSASTSNEARWDTGVVALTNSHASVLFDGAKIIPGYVADQCVTVKSDASGKTVLKMYADTVADVPSVLDSKIIVTIAEGTGGINTPGVGGGCANFVSVAPKFTGTLAEFKARNSYTNALDGSDLLAGGSAQYKIKVELPAVVGNEMQGKSTAVKFAWEARS